MKAAIVSLIAMLAACRVAMAADSFPDITTTDGKTYDHITAQRADPDGLYIEYSVDGNGLGCAKIKFSRLSPDLQKQFGYDADAAKKFEDDTYKATVAFRTWADQQDAARQKAEADAAARDLQEETLFAQLAQRMQASSAPQGQAAGYAQPYDNGYGYGYGNGWPYGLLAPRNAWTGLTYRGVIPTDILFPPLGFNPNRTQAISATPRGHGSFASIQRH